jgi:ribosome-binding protein aMBF1 (putative translation factor)
VNSREIPTSILLNSSLRMEERKKLSSDAFQWAYDRYIGNDPKEIALYEEERVKADIAQAIYNLRSQAGLSQEQLADLVGTNASVIEDIEEADYEGDFLSMASRIASVLYRRVEVRLVPLEDIESSGVSV